MNSEQSLSMIAQEAKEEFDSSLSNVAVGVQKSDILDVLEVISYLGSDPFVLTSPMLLANSYLIACNNSQNFIEDGENCEFDISVAHLGHLSHLLGDDFKYHDSKLMLQKLSVIIGTKLFTIGVKKQAP